jgi:hypothetical protein
MTYQPFRIENRRRGCCDTANIATVPAQTFATFAVSQGGQGRKTGHECARCGKPATLGVGWFIRQPEAARWFCVACAPTKGSA